LRRQEMAALVRSWVEKNRSAIVETTADLIRFDSVNRFTDGSEKACQLHVARLLASMGLETSVYSPDDAAGLHAHPAYYPGKRYANRPNVIGRLKGVGGGRSLLFSSHADTAVAAPGWTRDPWKPTVEGDRLYGLGAYDMKGGLAASIMAVRCVQELGVHLAGDVLLESVVDEEFGGANGTLAGRVSGFHADAAIIPEPTNLAICPASRGGALWRVTFSGTSGLSFNGETIVNPVYAAGKFIHYLEQYERERSRSTGPSPWYEQGGELPVVITRVEAGDMSAPLCDTGPAECHVDVWVECYPGTTEEQLQEEIMAGYRRQYGIQKGMEEPRFARMLRFLPGAQLEPDCPIVAALSSRVESVTRRPAVVRGAPFACDAFVFNLHSPTPAVILGPPGGHAHAPDEFVDIPGLCQLVEIYALTVIDWCEGEEG